VRGDSCKRLTLLARKQLSLMRSPHDFSNSFGRW
jgi:hypothetical protein